MAVLINNKREIIQVWKNADKEQIVRELGDVSNFDSDNVYNLDGVVGQLVSEDGLKVKNPLPNLGSQQDQAISSVIRYAEVTGYLLIGDVPESEQKGWNAKESAAREHIAGTASGIDTMLLKTEADLTGESIDDLAARVIEKANMFRVAVAMISGIRRKTTAAIKAATTLDGVNTILDDAKAQLDAVRSEIPDG